MLQLRLRAGILTCLTRGASRWRRGRATPNVVNSYHIELVLRIRTQGAHHIVHGYNAADLAEGLIRILRLVLNDIILQILGSLVRPLQTHRRCGHFGDLHIRRRRWQCCTKGETERRYS